MFRLLVRKHETISTKKFAFLIVEFFWSVFSSIWTEYRYSPYSVQMWENKGQKNSVFGQFLRSEWKVCSRC